jgi:DNA replication protein DnaC
MKSVYTKQCAYCHRFYTAQRKESKFCSDSCRVNAYKKRKGLWIPDFREMAQMQRKLPSAQEHKLLAVSSKIEHTKKSLFKLEEDYKRAMESYKIYMNSAQSAYTKYYEEQAEKYANEMERIANQMEVKTAELQDYEKKAQELNRNIEIENMRVSKKTYSAKDISKMEFEHLDFDGQYFDYFGRPARGFMMILHGMPFGGKTTFTLQFAQYLTRFGKVLFVSAEEGLTATFKSKIENLKIADVMFSDERFSEAILKDARRYDFVVIDSISKVSLAAERLEEWHQKNSKCAVIGILQSRRDGDYKGSAEYTHNADIVVAVNRNEIKIEKNRYL